MPCYSQLSIALRVIPPSPIPSPVPKNASLGARHLISHYLYDAPPPEPFPHSPVSLLLYPEDILSEAREET